MIADITKNEAFDAQLDVKVKAEMLSIKYEERRKQISPVEASGCYEDGNCEEGIWGRKA